MMSFFQQLPFEKFQHSDIGLSPDRHLGVSGNPGLVPFRHVRSCRIIGAGSWCFGRFAQAQVNATPGFVIAVCPEVPGISAGGTH